ncbi:MAG: MFS transporter [Halobacteriales archaeon]
MAQASRERAALGLVVFAALFSQAVLYAGLPDLVVALGAEDEIDAGTWFLGVELTAYVLFAAAWGALSDSTGRRTAYVTAAGYAAAALYVGMASAAFVSLGFDVVLVLRFLQGACAVGVLSLAMTMLMDLAGGHGRNMGAAGLAIGSAVAAGVPLGGALSEYDALTPLLAAAVSITVAASVARSVEDRAPGSALGAGGVFRGVAGRPILTLPYAFGFVDRYTAGFFALVGTYYLREVHGLDAAETGFTLAFFFVPFALLQYHFGRLSDRVGRVAPIVVGSIAYGVGVVAVGVAPSVDGVRVALLFVGALGALVAPATMALVTDLSRPTERGVAMGGFNVAGSLGFLAGVVVGGAVVSRAGYLTSFAVAGGLEIGIALAASPVFVFLAARDGVE